MHPIKKNICLFGCITNCLVFLFEVALCIAMPHLEEWFHASKQWLIIGDVAFLCMCFLVGNVVFDLDLDKLFRKYEDNPPTKTERIAFLIIINVIKVLVIVSILVAFGSSVIGIPISEITMLRIATIPGFSIINLIAFVGCYLSFQYYNG